MPAGIGRGTGDGRRKRTGLRLFFFYRAGAGACVRAHAPSWALRARTTFISSQRTKDNGSSQTTPKESGRKAKREASKENRNVRTKASIALHSENKEINHRKPRNLNRIKSDQPHKDKHNKDIHNQEDKKDTKKEK